jgi:hypothetical protein
MTAEEWDACTSLRALALAAPRTPRATARVLRLCAAAYWDWKAPRLPTALQRDGLLRCVAGLEAWAETGVEPEDSRAARERGDSRRFTAYTTDPTPGFRATMLGVGFSTYSGAVERAHEVIRCVFGNPFRPVTFSPSWRTETAVTLARQMYDARDFSAMPILADALQDAGCDNDDILSHCRGVGPHVRGCWVVDLVLGKE